MPLRQFSHEEVFKGLVYRIATENQEHTLDIHALNKAFIKGAKKFPREMQDFSYIGDYSFALAKMLVEFNSSVVRRTRAGYEITPPSEGQFVPREETRESIDFMFEAYNDCGYPEPVQK